MRLGGVPEAAAYLLFQLGYTSGYRLQLGDQLRHQGSDRWRRRIQVTIGNTIRRLEHLILSRLEIKALVGVLSRSTLAYVATARERSA